MFKWNQSMASASGSTNANLGEVYACSKLKNTDDGNHQRLTQARKKINTRMGVCYWRIDLI
jgi:hypothetical protein